MDDDQETRAPAASDIERVYASRKLAYRALEALDDSFFEQIEATLVENDDAKAALARTRRAHQRAGLLKVAQMNAMGFGLGRSSEGSVDLIRIVEAQDFDEARMKQIRSILDAYEDAHLEALVEQYDVQLVMQQAQELWNATSWEARKNGNWSAEMGQSYRETLKAPSEKTAELRSRIARMNRSAIDEIVTALGPEPGDAARRAYRRAAFPGIFEDPTSVQSHLSRALELEDITVDQRSQLAEIASAYRPEYERLSMSMAEISAASTDVMTPMSMEATDWQTYQDREMKIQRLQFDRTELNERTINRMRHLLGEDQIRRVGGLPEPVEEKRFGF